MTWVTHHHQWQNVRNQVMHPRSRILPSVIGGLVGDLAPWFSKILAGSIQQPIEQIPDQIHREGEPAHGNSDAQEQFASMCHQKLPISALLLLRPRAGRMLGGHSMTLSARASRVGGTVRPIARAVFRLMTRLNLVGI